MILTQLSLKSNAFSQTALNQPFKDIQGHQFRYQLKAYHMQLPISE